MDTDEEKTSKEGFCWANAKRPTGRKSRSVIYIENNADAI